MLALCWFFYIVINEFIFYVEFFICYHMCLKFSFYFILLLYLELIFFWVFGLISIFFFFWETKMGTFIVILHPRAGSQYRDQLDEAQPSTVWGGQPSLSMPTNGLLRAARIEPRCGTQNERTLPTQPSPCWPGLSPYLYWHCFHEFGFWVEISTN